MFTMSRRAVAGLIAAAALLPGASFAAEPLKEIRLDWATYNPVSIILKQNGLLEKEFAKDGVKITWVQSAGSNKALEFLNAGSIDFGSTAGAAALIGEDQRQPDQVDLRLFASGMDRAGDRAKTPRSPRSPISRASASRSPAAPIRTSSWSARWLERRSLTEKDVKLSSAAACRWQGRAGSAAMSTHGPVSTR
jgi:hypothetical protein